MCVCKNYFVVHVSTHSAICILAMMSTKTQSHQQAAKGSSMTKQKRACGAGGGGGGVKAIIQLCHLEYEPPRGSRCMI